MVNVKYKGFLHTFECGPTKEDSRERLSPDTLDQNPSSAGVFRNRSRMLSEQIWIVVILLFQSVRLNAEIYAS